MANWRHSLKQMFTQGSTDDAATSGNSLSPPTSSSSSIKGARRKSLLDLLSRGGDDDEGNNNNNVDDHRRDGSSNVINNNRSGNNVVIVGDNNDESPVATDGDGGVQILSVNPRDPDSQDWEKHKEEEEAGSEVRGRPIFTLSSVDDDESSDTSDSSEEEEEEEDDDDDDDDTLVLGQSTLTLTTLDGAAGQNLLLLEDSVEGRLAKLFEDDIDFVVSTVLSMRDGPRKVLFIQEAMRHLRAIRTAATINSHFIVLSSLCTDIGSRRNQREEQEGGDDGKEGEEEDLTSL